MKVTKKIENLENSSVKLTVTIGKADVAASYNEVVAKYAKKWIKSIYILQKHLIILGIFVIINP